MAWTKVDQETQNPSRTSVVYSEEVVDSNDKSLVYGTDPVAISSRLTITNIRIEYGATATVGIRILVARILDSTGDIIRELQFVQTIIADGNENYEVSVGVAQATGTVVNYEQLPADFVLLRGQTLRIFDLNDIQALDDMIIHVTAETGN